jgi:hypothetical protein
MSEISVWEQVVKRWSKRHGVNDEHSVVGKSEDDDFEELPIAARTDHQDLGRISVGVHVDDDHCMVDGVEYVSGANAMASGRAMKLYPLIAIRIIGQGQAETTPPPHQATDHRSPLTPGPTSGEARPV